MGLPAFDPNQPFTEDAEVEDSLPKFDPALPFEEDKTEESTPVTTPSAQSSPTSLPSPQTPAIPVPANRGAPSLTGNAVDPLGRTGGAIDDMTSEKFVIEDAGTQNDMQAYQTDVVSAGVNSKMNPREEALRLYNKYPNLFWNQPKDRAIKQIEYGVSYYRMGHTGKVKYVVSESEADQTSPPITVTADRSKVNQLRSRGPVLDAISDFSSGFGEGVDRLNNQSMRLLAKGTDAVGLTDDAVNVMDDLIRVADNKRETTFVNPDGYARPVGEFIGENAILLPLSEVAPFTRLLGTGGGAIATAGDLAVQGGITGTLMSGGENVLEGAASSAFLTSLFAGLPFHPNPDRTSVKFKPARETPEGSVADFEISTPEGSMQGAAHSDGKVEFTEPVDAGLKRILGKEDIVEPISPEPHVSDEVLTRLTQALKNAGGVKEEQAAMFKKQRAERFAAASNALRQGSGVDAFTQAKSQLKGALDAPAFEGIGDQFSLADRDALAQRIVDTSSLSTTGKFSAFEGLKKVMQGDIPAAKELQYLSEAFPTDFLQEVMAKRSTMSKTGGVFSEIWNTPKSLMSSLDLSAPLRQGVGFVHKTEFRSSAKEMIRYATDAKHYDDLVSTIRSDELYPLARDADLGITAAGDDIGPREDAFSAYYVERIPGIGDIVQWSERGYVGFLNKLRFDVFKDMVKTAEKAGLDIRNDPKALKATANFINIMTGRGSLGDLEKASGLFNAIFFSPRLISSRLQILTAPLAAPFGKGFIADLPKELRVEALKSYGGMAAYYTTAISLASLAGYEISSNPLSSDFGKIKDGDTRIDLGGGLLQYITVGARAVMRASTSTTSGSTRELTKTGDTPLDNDLRFIINKLHPSLSLLFDQQRGKNTVGEKFEWGSAILQRLTPMGLPDIYGTLKEHPNANGVLYATLGLLGAGLQNYPSKDSQRASESGLPSFDPDGTFEEIPGKSTEDVKPKPEVKTPDVKEDKPKNTLPSFDRNKPFDVSTEDNITATSIIRGLGLHTTDIGIRSNQRQAKYYRTTRGAAPPGYGPHEKGNAVDIRVPRDGTKPSQVVSELEQAGYYGVSIITRAHGTGPHWHVQWKGRKTE